jgi:hypothetical protein
MTVAGKTAIDGHRNAFNTLGYTHRKLTRLIKCDGRKTYSFSRFPIS